MSDDPRLVAARCHARTTHIAERMNRSEFVCIFKEGHSGLHYSNEAWVEGHPQSVLEVVRWGTQEQLDAETRTTCARCGNPGPLNSSGWCQDCASPVYT